ncbi:hopanoid biosynthesis associated radical SAM protein HpnJ [Slackia heliotrinireducens]|uniref:Fe-S oxidoreductase n=1 Tax=Slackia heliotrinireducens (strain ATCC 29202 / DSM 20476 / NCTC 11029 / RHS 1) TaxID=471855 RepID=C7N2V7_SLAHD|nr:radical SAM protein [Slackia heliotrinireducens]ACV21478.1 Fe-S oxidoreductase [Slackia heliotrinireducens DSM 20476]VEG98917.1 hopanoid biosynthesis associated radical SAM protein HpnJ [Slackia heliotrinireducens]
MHFTEPVYRNPYWPTWPLLEVTQGCTHNKCKFCTMYKGVRFDLRPLEDIEADLAELRSTVPHARTIQLLSANPLALPYSRFKPILEKINEYLPDIEFVYTQGRVTDLRNKTVEQLRELRDLGLREISMGTESGDDWTLDRVNKGYHAEDIIEQCAKLDEAGIRYWHSFLNGVAGRSHSREHAVNSAKIFSQTNPMLVGTGGLTLFPGTPLLEEAQVGEFDPLSEKEMFEELLLFVENLTCDCSFITHHTIGGENLSGPNFLARKDDIIASLRDEIEHGDLDTMARIRAMKRSL